MACSVTNADAEFKVEDEGDSGAGVGDAVGDGGALTHCGVSRSGVGRSCRVVEGAW